MRLFQVILILYVLFTLSYEQESSLERDYDDECNMVDGYISTSGSTVNEKAKHCKNSKRSGGGKPILFIHGLDGSYKNCTKFRDYAYKKGHKVYGLDFRNDIDSNAPFKTQVKELISALKKIQQHGEFSGGYDIVAHGQGALIARCAIQSMSDHRVKNFVSLAGVNAGYASASSLPAHTYGGLSDGESSYVAQYWVQQKHSGSTNAWRDRDYAKYLNSNKFLAECNNEIGVKFNPKYVVNFMRLKKFIAYGSPAEERIKPWYTSLFDYDGPNGERVFFNQQWFWALGMPLVPRTLLEMQWEPTSAATLTTGTSAVMKSYAEADTIAKNSNDDDVQKYIKNAGVSGERCAAIPYPSAVGIVPPLGLSPCPPCMTSYVVDSIKHTPAPNDAFENAPFTKPSVPGVVKPSTYYRGFGLFELSRKGGLYRFELPGISYWDWLEKESVFDHVLKQLDL